MKGITVAIVSILFLAGCTATQEIRRPDGTMEYLITCGVVSGWNVCYDKANHICPGGYTTLLEDTGIRKELRISCPSAKKPSQ